MFVFGAICVAIAAVCVASFRSFSGDSSAVAVRLVAEPVRIADVTATIAASGTLEPEELVDVGSQVSGKIVSFGTDADGAEVDYCSVVTNGMVLARIDDVTYLADLEVARASLANAEASVASAKAGLAKAEIDCEHAKKDWDRAVAVGVGMALSQSDYDSWQAAWRSAEAQVAVARAAVSQAGAQVVQARASVEKAERNLGYCTIVSPVDGVVIDRRVNLGQTVVSSMNVSSLFLVARDLRRMRIWASVNEADVGSIRAGQPVTFAVDALPGRSFAGTVRKVRLNATLSSNVVTYTVEIDVANEDLALLPYLTASVEFETRRERAALAVPARALRWAPASVGDGASASPRVADGTGTVWVLDSGDGGDGASADARRDPPPPPRPVAVEVLLNNGSLAAVRPLEPGALSEGRLVVVREESAVPGTGTGASGGTSAGGANNPFLPKLPRPPRRGGAGPR